MKNLHKTIFARQADIFNQESLNLIKNPEGKVRTYSMIKEMGGMEQYLIDTKNVEYRTVLAKFRLSNHKLMIEKGRHLKMKIENRVCPSCQSIEDEIHFLINCKA